MGQAAVQLRANVARSPGGTYMVLSRLPFPALSVHQPVAREAIRKHDEQEEKIIMENPSVTITYKLANGKRISIEVSASVKEALEETDRKIRSQRRQDRRHIDFVEYIDELSDPAMINPQSDPADLVIRMESYIQLYAAIDKLSEVQRRRLLLYLKHNLTYQQIADLEGVNKSAIGQSIKRSIEQLYKLLTD